MSLLTHVAMIVFALLPLVACSTAPSVESPSLLSGITHTQIPESADQQRRTQVATAACPVTKPYWAKPPDDAAVQNSTEFGYYFMNSDRSIWATAWWTGQKESLLRVNKEGTKVGWFRPAGAELAIKGQRLDAPAPALTSSIPCCYPTRFQSSALFFPTEGCWEITATADASTLSFIVWVAP